MGWSLGLTLAAADAWATRFSMNPDGVSYLDMGDAIWRGDLHAAINGHWSPLYPCVAGLVLKVLRPSMYWEFPVVHLLNLVIFVWALIGFEFLLKNFIARRKNAKPSPNSSATGLPEWAWWLLGYSVFLPASLTHITMRRATPDLLLSGFIYLAAGLLLRIRSAPQLKWFVLLGIVLGFAYLTKAVMFPLAFSFMVTAIFLNDNRPRALRLAGVSLLLFLVLAGPLVYLLSRAKGRFTISDSGRWAYLVFLNGVQPFFPDSPNLTHPLKKISNSPPVYDLSSAPLGTYPPWSDPSYWQDGIKPRLNLIKQAKSLFTSTKAYLRALYLPSMQLNFTSAFLLLLALGRRPREVFERMEWLLVAPAIAALAVYAPLLVEFRYIAPFTVFFWLGLFSGITVPVNRMPRTIMSATVIAVVVTSLILLAGSSIRRQKEAEGPVYSQAAQALREKGIQAGDKVALIWDEEYKRHATEGSYVPRLLKTRVVVEASSAKEFWQADPSWRSHVIQLLAQTGAKAAITVESPPDAGNCWERLDGTEFYACMLFGTGHAPSPDDF